MRVQSECRWVWSEEEKKQFPLNLQSESEEAGTYLEIRSEGPEVLIQKVPPTFLSCPSLNSQRVLVVSS